MGLSAQQFGDMQTLSKSFSKTEISQDFYRKPKQYAREVLFIHIPES